MSATRRGFLMGASAFAALPLPANAADPLVALYARRQQLIPMCKGTDEEVDRVSDDPGRIVQARLAWRTIEGELAALEPWPGIAMFRGLATAANKAVERIRDEKAEGSAKL